MINNPKCDYASEKLGQILCECIHIILKVFIKFIKILHKYKVQLPLSINLLTIKLNILVCQYIYMFLKK